MNLAFSKVPFWDPLVVNLNINDMHKCSSLDLLHFADDASVIAQGPIIRLDNLSLDIRVTGASRFNGGTIKRSP